MTAPVFPTGRCAGISLTGLRCTAHVWHGNERCYFHPPESDARELPRLAVRHSPCAKCRLTLTHYPGDPPRALCARCSEGTNPALKQAESVNGREAANGRSAAGNPTEGL